MDLAVAITIPVTAEGLSDKSMVKCYADRRLGVLLGLCTRAGKAYVPDRLVRERLSRFPESYHLVSVLRLA